MEQKEKMKAELEDLRIELHAQEEEERLKQAEIVINYQQFIFNV